MSSWPDEKLIMELHFSRDSGLDGLIIGSGKDIPILIRAYRALKPVRDITDNILSIIDNKIIFNGYKKLLEKKLKNDVPLSTLLRVNSKNLLKNLESQIISLTGLSKISGDPLKVIYLGDKKSLRYLRYLFFSDDNVTQVELGRFLTKNVQLVANHFSESCDLMVFEKPFNNKWVPDYGEWVCSPRWVRMVKRFSPNTTKEEIRLSYWKYQHTNYYRSQKLGLSRVISQKGSDFDFFYDSMYLPSMRNRHNSYGAIEEKKDFKNKAKNGFLILLCRSDGTPVAGSYNFSKEKILFSDMNGVLLGDSQLLSKGALAAIYISTMDFAIENRYTCLDMGLTTPLLSDGVFIHKSRWGFEPIRCPWHVMEWLWWNPNNSKSGLEILSTHLFHKKYIAFGGRYVTGLYHDS